MLADRRTDWTSGSLRASQGLHRTRATPKEPPPLEQGSLAHLVPVRRVLVKLHLPLHPLQVGLQEALELLTVADFILEGPAVIDHGVHPVHVDELWGGGKAAAALCTGR